MSSESEPTRREALGKMLLIGAAASVGFLGTTGLLIFLKRSSQAQSTANPLPSPAPEQVSSGQSLLNITVFYLGMARLIGTSRENFTISSPAFLSDLLKEVCEEHAVLQTMPSMQILLNGRAAYDNPLLNNGDQVTFAATMAGG